MKSIFYKLLARSFASLRSAIFGDIQMTSLLFSLFHYLARKIYQYRRVQHLPIGLDSSASDRLDYLASS